MLSIFINFVLILDIIVCLLLILLTLMQRPKNEGLGAAFGGGMTENLFGADTSNVLAKATRILGGLFFFLTLGLSMLYTHKANSLSSVQAKLASKPVPAAVAPAEPKTPADIENTVKAAVEEQLKKQGVKASPATTPAASATPAAPAAAATAPVATPTAPAATPAK